ncbi:SDR family NAD(P)-dependent oxidoreductase [Carboxydothermus hydrogenoformans]|uniref:Oxidoreductase, short chain dehydrogenase/reductase family n=1 Tax=Carboxydothermus hydrogenoformans (strain ATCC BAA-161 / DSM 6008 / Z-2901) TaxID=246194 RepID=Q3ACV3_CARHZ|nr:glucose 1-dehydrogenase [Carboxydothermus hydrogenoformans]ABB13712.1 oxidoreductase, short chain dehydrogenase/reductase family [Carboxydothermus hydrogenoformans Z-2901]
MGFKDKVVVVTGSGRGIGRSIAKMYAEHGAKVVIADRNFQEALETERLISEEGGEAMAVLADVSKPEDVINLMEKIEKSYGRLDILINNAGFGCWKSPYDLTVEEWDSVINTNLRGTFLCSREAAKIMKKGGGGAIVNIASTRAIMSEPNSESYAASKGGILALTHALAISLGPDRIRVNAISPGWIETGEYEKLREIDHLQHPAGRVGKPEDIARACLFLTAEENSFITGANLVIDGGMTRKMIYEP